MFQKFLADLQQSLKRLPLEDRERISEYYTELYFDKKDHGQNEDDIVISFGNISLIAERILRDYQSRIENPNFNDYTSPLGQNYNTTVPPINQNCGYAAQSTNTDYTTTIPNNQYNTNQNAKAPTQPTAQGYTHQYTQQNTNHSAANNGQKSYTNTSYLGNPSATSNKSTVTSVGNNTIRNIILNICAILCTFFGITLLIAVGVLIYMMITYGQYLLFAGLIAIILGISFISFGFSSLFRKYTKKA